MSYIALCYNSYTYKYTHTHTHTHTHTLTFILYDFTGDGCVGSAAAGERGRASTTAPAREALPQTSCERCHALATQERLFCPRVVVPGRNCVCVCVYVHTYVCVYIHLVIYVYTHIVIYIYIIVCVCVYRAQSLGLAGWANTL